MKYDLKNLIDVAEVDVLLNSFNKATGFVTAVLDLEGNILSKSGWRKICTEFHRKHPESEKNCIMSDTVLSRDLNVNKQYSVYKCLNGLVDVAIPIVLNGEHIGNIFTGQFFFNAPEKEYFLKQAEKYGFEKATYLAAMEEVPVVSEDHVKDIMTFLLKMTQFISQMALVKKEQSELIEALKTAHDEMEAKVEERTHELSEVNIKLLELDHLKSMFIASMSHELRTPLNSIIGFTGLILQGISGKVDDTAREDLDIVYNASKHLLSLINDVIDITKIEAGKFDVYFENTDITEVVSDVITTVSKDAEKKKLEITTEFAGELNIKTDRRRLFQCLLNLVSNAVKYTEKGSVKIEVRKTENLLKIAVTDTGIGIKNEDMPKLFTSFVRLDSHIKDVTLGTGLGLYLSKKIMTGVFNGDIPVQSEYGKGSTFTLEIPIITEK